MLLKGIVLKCFTHIQNERTSAAVFHLLQGKRSIQTIHDAHLFNISQFYGIDRKLDKNIFNKIIIELNQDDYLSQTQKTTLEFKVTSAGYNWLIKNKKNMHFHFYNGLEYQTIDQVFFERLILLIQVLSNSKMKNTKYVPVIEKMSIINWVKKNYTYYKLNINKNLQALYVDLNDILTHFSNKQANLFIDRFTSYKNYGLSKQQLALVYELPEEDIQVLLAGMVHKTLSIIYENKNKYPFLRTIISDFSEYQLLTQSAEITKKLLNKYDDIEKIANIRKLTLNTIYDHIVEIALHDNNFEINPYVTKTQKQSIIQAIAEANTSKLRHIKAYLNDDISYFQIRLVLATYDKVVKGDDEK